jgi:type I restriction enzyme M protein
MLDNQTKKIIDSARDVLVGKLPAPNTQVEQITLAMLYKFMDDIDQESIDLGGNVAYFSDEYEKYSWRNIMSKTISAQNRMNLYVEALEKFYSHSKLPKTFKDIFKNASVPYRDPEVLTLFLREIEKLSYGDSETLGDAYEYLLSILGSQGELGQFRTPRHIIDFIVSIINPQKKETILDPACGTAGFLISAYKHIVLATENNNLSYEEKVKVLDNITGFDIEPSMVRIAEMNMYLHGCTNPNIYEYDSLTSDDKWDERFDVILANPPFMTPIGGIKPHKRFQVQANRAEVLFVDYIVEHLRSNGRAGIIVPDSILYNESSSAYIELRKLLTSEGLIGIISLPAGLFKPYAKDIKTSILIINKRLSKKTNKVLMVNIDHDGFSLTDTRKPIKKNDLPSAKKLINEYLQSIEENKDSNFMFDNCELSTYLFDKEKMISKNYVLLQNRYEDEIVIKSDYKIVKLEDLIVESKEKVGNSLIISPWSVSNKLGFTTSDELFNDQIHSENLKSYKKIQSNYFAYNPSRINVGSIALNETDKVGCVSPMYVVFRIKETKLITPKYLFLLLKSDYINKIISKQAYGAVRKQLKFEGLKKISIPLPSINKQIEIMRLIELENEKMQTLKKELYETEIAIQKKINNIWDNETK